MPSERLPDVKLEIGHVLFIDIVGYSKLFISEQSKRFDRLSAFSVFRDSELALSGVN
jgi:hypothetical protein